jgi:16S rRNA (guanine527-N7)-methyltransferase
VKPDISGDAASIGLGLEPSAATALQTYLALLRDRAIPLGLVAASDADRLYERHVLDSLRAATELRRGDRLVLDLGSGAGLPGLVLAAAVPGASFLLVEPRRRAAGFLELAVERLGLPNVEVVMSRAEEVSETVDVATARAFAPMAGSWEAAWPLLRPGGRLVYFAGRELEDPRDEAERIRRPESPSAVRTSTVIASSAPLVIMSRRG